MKSILVSLLSHVQINRVHIPYPKYLIRDAQAIQTFRLLPPGEGFTTPESAPWRFF